MKKITLFAALLLGTASAANVSGSQTTPLTLKVNNFCQLSGTGGRVSNSFSRTYPALDLGAVNAVTNHVVNSVIVAGVDCNKGTTLNVVTPKKVTISNGTSSFDITTDAWGPQHPLTMSFDQSGSKPNDEGYGTYNYHEVRASFHVGGSATLLNRAWSIPGGLYKGDLVISYNYDE